MFADRQLRLRVLEALDTRVKQFVRRDELWPLRVPREPLLLDDIIRQTLADDAGRFDPETLRTRTLLLFEWADGSWWRAWVGALPSGLKIYCDSGEHESRMLASGGRNEGDESDRAFLELFGESAGRHFGIEMSGGAPRSVRSPFPRDLLVEMFVNLFEVTGAEDSVRGQLTRVDAARGTAPPAGHDFRADVEEWLDAALRRRSLISSPAP